MNDFLYAHKKTFTNSKGQNLTLFLDVNLKKNSVSNIWFEGSLALELQEEITLVTDTFLNQTLQSIPKIEIVNSLPLWLFYRTLDEYQGHVAIIKNECDDLVCLCFGITKNELKNGKPTMAGRACGSCLPFIKKKEFRKIAGMYPGPLVVKLDELTKEWSQTENTEVSILEINDDHLEVKITPYDKAQLRSLSDYFFAKLGARFFLRASL